MNRIFSLFIALSLLTACGKGTNKSGKETAAEIIPITVAEFIGDAGPFVDQAVQISGTVVHVCRHGGQKMFIIGEDGEERIRITTGEDIAEFQVDLEGEKVEVTGYVRELIIDDTYLAEWEAEVLTGGQMDRGEGHEGGVGHGEHPEASQDPDQASQAAEPDSSGQDAENQKEAQLANIQKIRDEIAESGKDHLSDYWIETIEFKVIKD